MKNHYNDLKREADRVAEMLVAEIARSTRWQDVLAASRALEVVRTRSDSMLAELARLEGPHVESHGSGRSTIAAHD